MPTEQGIADCIELLIASGCALPKATSISAIGAAWSITMPEVDDDRLMAACLLHVRSSESAWWPKPGQLLNRITERQDDHSGEDWGRLRVLRRVHGVLEPLSPNDPRTFALASNRAEAQARWLGIEACGGWDQFAHRADPISFRQGYDRAISSAERQISTANWSQKVQREVQDFLQFACASSAWRLVCEMKEACGSDRPFDPREPLPYRLHDEPRRERAMAAGLAAAGGWREIWPDGSTIPESLRASDAANRRAFVEAHRASMRRTQKRSEAHRVAALVDLTSDTLAIPMADKGSRK